MQLAEKNCFFAGVSKSWQNFCREKKPELARPISPKFFLPLFVESSLFVGFLMRKDTCISVEDYVVAVEGDTGTDELLVFGRASTASSSALWQFVKCFVVFSRS
jgi:hypothetical protein